MRTGEPPSQIRPSDRQIDTSRQRPLDSAYTDGMTQAAPLIALNVGNTRTQLGRFEDGKLTATERFENRNLSDLVQQVVAWWGAMDGSSGRSIVLASVNDDLAKRLTSAIEDQLSVEVYRVGDDLPVPVGQQLDPETLTGVDRLLNAAAAYDILGQACVVIDAGTAVTVDFVDGEGTFHGGAIAPGARLQLQALHQFTSALPEIDFRAPENEAFGRNTAEAMLQGVYFGIRGMVWKLVEQYADRYGAYPTIVATGGDAELLFSDDELVERVVPELTLLGIAACVKQALRSADEEEQG